VVQFHIHLEVLVYKLYKVYTFKMLLQTFFHLVYKSTVLFHSTSELTSFNEVTLRG